MDMHNKASFVIVGIALVAIALIVSFVFIFRSEDDSTSTPAAPTSQETVTPDEAVQSVDEGRADESSQETDSPEITPAEEETVTDSGPLVTTPPTEPGNPPDDWGELSAREKVTLNPLDCDLETEIMHADDGSCHPKPDDQQDGTEAEEDAADETVAGTDDEDEKQSVAICPPGYRHFTFNNIDQCVENGKVVAQYPLDAWRDYLNKQTTAICPPGYKHLIFNSIDQCVKDGEVMAQYPSDAWRDYRAK